jgi:single-strand DNA-binding protein
MINSVILTGRIVRDPELKKSSSGNSYCNFSLAIDKRFKNPASGEREADFIPCVAFGQNAEFVCKNFKKGNLLGTQGSISTSVVTDASGAKRYTFDVVVDQFHFLESKRDGSYNQNSVAADLQESNKLKEFKGDIDNITDEDIFG